MAGAGTAYDLFADRMGSITHVVDTATNTIAAEYTYDSFGNRSAVGTLDQRYGFTAREVDGETGLIYFRARHYDPSVGQFIQQDPIGFAAGDMNLYAYVWNNPYTYTDPSGEAVTVPRVVLISGILRLCARFCDDIARIGAKSGAGKKIGSLAAAALGGVGQAIRNAMAGIAKNIGDILKNSIGGDDETSSESDSDSTSDSDSDGDTGPRNDTNPNTGNNDVDDLLEGSERGDSGDKGWQTPGSKDSFENGLRDKFGSDNVKPHGGGGVNVTTPDGSRINTYGTRSSTGRPGWSVTPNGSSSPSHKGSFMG